MAELVPIFAALGDPTRFALVERLMTEGELPAGRLQDVADISPPAISRHLKVLLEVGLVTKKIDKQRRIYAVEPDAVKAISAWTMSHKDFWSGSLNRLADALKAQD